MLFLLQQHRESKNTWTLLLELPMHSVQPAVALLLQQMLLLLQVLLRCGERVHSCFFRLLLLRQMLQQGDRPQQGQPSSSRRAVLREKK